MNDEDTAGRWGEIGVWVQRSELDDSVWVPISVETDYTVFLHAGGLRAVKRWAAEMYVAANERHRWRRDGSDKWELETRLR